MRINQRYLKKEDNKEGIRYMVQNKIKALSIIEASSADRPFLIKNDMQGIWSEALSNLKEMQRVGILVRTFDELPIALIKYDYFRK